jgi:hypothetical protein
MATGLRLSATPPDAQPRGNCNITGRRGFRGAAKAPPPGLRQLRRRGANPLWLFRVSPASSGRGAGGLETATADRGIHVVVDAIRTGNIVVIAFLATGILSSLLFA